MLKNKDPKVLIELSENNFSKVEFIWLVPTIVNKTNLIGFAFKNSTDLDNFKNGLNNNSIQINFGEVDITIDENVYDKCNSAALIKFPNFEIVP